MKTFPKALAMNSFLVHFAAAFQMLAPGPQTFCRKHKMLEMRLKGLESCFSPYPRPASCKAFRKSKLLANFCAPLKFQGPRTVISN